METLLKGRCDRSSFQNNCRALHSSAFSSEHPSVSLRVLLELAARWHRASAPSARTSLTDPLLIWCWRSSVQRAGSWAAFSDDSLISHEYRFASSYTAELYARHASIGPNGTVAFWNGTWKVTLTERSLFCIWADSVNGRFFTAKDSSWGSQIATRQEQN